MEAADYFQMLGVCTNMLQKGTSCTKRRRRRWRKDGVSDSVGGHGPTLP